jgi:hypothetical protein
VHKLYNKEHNDLYSLPNTIWVIKLRIIWVGHVACMVEKCTHGFGGETSGKETTWKTQAKMGR